MYNYIQIYITNEKNMEFWDALGTVLKYFFIGIGILLALGIVLDFLEGIGNLIRNAIEGIGNAIKGDGSNVDTEKELKAKREFMDKNPGARC